MLLTCPDSFCSVDQDQWYRWKVVIRLDLCSVFEQIIENTFIGGMEYGTSDPWHFSIDITRTGGIFASLDCQQARRLKANSDAQRYEYQIDRLAQED